MKFSRIGLAAAAVAMLALTACSGGQTSDPASSSGASVSGSFPATVDTKFGEVTVKSAPKRIVALGWGDAETVLALGGQPVGASDWLAFGGDGVGPWAKGLYTESPKLIDTLKPSYEAIAALKPDLILDVKSSGDEARYERLSSIAPTIGVPKDGDSYLTSMDEQMTMISTALGQADKGKELLAAVDKQYEAAAAAHPDWKGKTVAAATRTSEGWGAYIEGSERVTFLERLGFVQSPKVAALKPNASGFSVDISAEQLDQLDADLIVAFPIFIDTKEITDDALWKAIPAVADGRSVVIDGDVSSAYSLGTTLAASYAIEHVVPLIEKALG
ncbi:iron-siderophore ABC transporter substrate-binding protein [Plantibacter sp. YIM 135249]|uniref:iron-siderophore ABC transporter substrate-binding protein n=1 Tax=Plantibacter sp. YIM 135249 TaxID=3423918 RepID=UPI003D334F35